LEEAYVIGTPGRGRVTPGKDRVAKEKENVMSKFHSSMSRRDFMKALGLAGAGLGAAAATAPVFHDLDEVMASSSLEKHPWYVKERELFDPTVEVDWNIAARYDRTYMGQCARVQAIYYGEDRVRNASANSGALGDQQLKNNIPGFGHKWEALRGGTGVSTSWSDRWTGPSTDPGSTPEEMGVPKWNGTPEENKKLLTIATRLFGAGEIGTGHLDTTWRNKLVAYNWKGGSTGDKYIGMSRQEIPDTVAVPIVYENVPHPYEEANKKVIPTGDRYILFIEGPEPRETDRTAISRMSKSNLVSNGGIRKQCQEGTYKFLKALGYECFGGTGHGNDAFQSASLAILLGKGEAARMNNWPISLSYGPRSFDLGLITDMPLPTSHPVDAGIWKFCQTCGICADACPSNSIPKLDDPDYPDGPRFDKPNINGIPDTQHANGPKLFWFNGSSCNNFRKEQYPGSGCSLCAADCTFSVGHQAIVHSVMKTTIATTGIFNGFLANMGRTFGYGAYEDPEEFWDLSLPMLGIDSTVTALHGGY
jgi:reductive dehalogenase